MNLIRKFFLRTERAYLAYHIVNVRPDLAGKPFSEQLSTYIADAVAAFVEAEHKHRDSPGTVKRPRLSRLLSQAIGYQSFKSKRYYQTQYLLYKERCERLTQENEDYINQTIDLRIENLNAYQIARQATDMAQASSDMLQAVKYPAGKLN